MPVEDYPELAFEPTNGVPLCGNCHVAIKGDELAHADDLKRRQRDIMSGNTPADVKDAPSELALRERAFAEPSSAEAVLAWFAASKDSQAVADFYDQHREQSTQNIWLCAKVAGHLQAIGRWQDSISLADRAMEISEREGTLERAVESIASWKWKAMREIGQGPEAMQFLSQLVGRFPMLPALHQLLSRSFRDAYQDAVKLAAEPWLAENDLYKRRKAVGNSRDAKDAIEGYMHHALEAAQLAPDEFDYAWQACGALHLHGVHHSEILGLGCDYRSAFEYGKRAYALASSREQMTTALLVIAGVCMSNRDYADARAYLREALQIDKCNVGVIAKIAKCLIEEDNERDAIRMAKRGLMLDPENQDCKRILNMK